MPFALENPAAGSSLCFVLTYGAAMKRMPGLQGTKEAIKYNSLQVFRTCIWGSRLALA